MPPKSAKAPAPPPPPEPVRRSATPPARDIPDGAPRAVLTTVPTAELRRVTNARARAQRWMEDALARAFMRRGALACAFRKLCALLSHSPVLTTSSVRTTRSVQRQGEIQLFSLSPSATMCYSAELRVGGSHHASYSCGLSMLKTVGVDAHAYVMRRRSPK